jgi:hypothetical protein
MGDKTLTYMSAMPKYRPDFELYAAAPDLN